MICVKVNVLSPDVDDDDVTKEPASVAICVSFTCSKRSGGGGVKGPPLALSEVTHFHTSRDWCKTIIILFFLKKKLRCLYYCKRRLFKKRGSASADHVRNLLEENAAFENQSLSSHFTSYNLSGR